MARKAAQARRKREKADQRCNEIGARATVSEVQRRICGKLRTCYLVTSAEPVTRPGLTLGAIEGVEISVQRLKRSLETTQTLQEHENPLLNERLAWEEWLAERPRLGRKGARKRNKMLFCCIPRRTRHSFPSRAAKSSGSSSVMPPRPGSLGENAIPTSSSTP